MTRLKVCCIQDRGELETAAGVGATFVGLVGAMPSGPGPIPDGRIGALVAEAPAGLTPVLLTARATAAGIEEHLRATGFVERVRAGLPAGVQLVRHLPAGTRAELRARLPGLTVLQVLHVEGEDSVEAVKDLAPHADHILLDSGRPGGRVVELGGTGRTHDWSLSRRVVARAPVPVLLAGGLGPDNVARAVARVGPWGVDVCSGLRDEGGALLPERLTAFVEALRGPGHREAGR